MTPRERMRAAFEYAHPDKIPVVYHPSPAGLLVHGQKLLDLFNQYPPDNPITFDALPSPPPGATDENGSYYELRKDDWGTTWEFKIFGVQGHPKTYPFNSWAEAEDYPFPPKPSANPGAFQAERKRVAAQKEQYLIFLGGVSIFERLHALRPFDEVLVDIMTRAPDLMRFLDRLTAYWAECIQDWLALGADVISFGDDWGTQTAQLVSTETFQEVFRPRYEQLMTPVKRAGKKVFFHSCGHLGQILDELFTLGIDGFWPQITAYPEHDLPARCHQHRVAMYIHPDRQRLVPLGAPQEIDTAMAQYAQRYHRLGGGGIFYIEMENDAPWENVKALIEAVHRYR